MIFFISSLFSENSIGRLNQQSSWVMRKFLILRLISSYPEYKNFFHAWSAFFLGYKKKNFYAWSPICQKNVRKFFRLFFLVFRAWGWKVRQVAFVFATSTVLCYYYQNHQFCNNSILNNTRNILHLHYVDFLKNLLVENFIPRLLKLSTN